MSEVLEIYDELHARGLVREAVIGLTRPCRIIKDYVSLVGSTAREGAGNDIDVVIKGRENAVMGDRVLKLFPGDLRHKVHLLWEGDSPGVPHGTYVPMFDLCIFPSDHTIVEMKSGRFTPGRRFIPSKTTNKTFFESNKVEEFLSKSEGGRWAVEQKFPGLRAVLHRRGNNIKIYDDRAMDITRSFPSIVEQSKTLTTKDFIIDGEMMLYDEKGSPLSKSDLERFVLGGQRPSDKNIKYHVFDILYLR